MDVIPELAAERGPHMKMCRHLLKRLLARKVERVTDELVFSHILCGTRHGCCNPAVTVAANNKMTELQAYKIELLTLTECSYLQYTFEPK